MSNPPSPCKFERNPDGVLEELYTLLPKFHGGPPWPPKADWQRMLRLALEDVIRLPDPNQPEPWNRSLAGVAKAVHQAHVAMVALNDELRRCGDGDDDFNPFFWSIWVAESRGQRDGNRGSSCADVTDFFSDLPDLLRRSDRLLANYLENQPKPHRGRRGWKPEIVENFYLVLREVWAAATGAAPGVETTNENRKVNRDGHPDEYTLSDWGRFADRAFRAAGVRQSVISVGRRMRKQYNNFR